MVQVSLQFAFLLELASHSVARVDLEFTAILLPQRLPYVDRCVTPHPTFLELVVNQAEEGPNHIPLAWTGCHFSSP